MRRVVPFSTSTLGKEGLFVAINDTDLGRCLVGFVFPNFAPSTLNILNFDFFFYLKEGLWENRFSNS